MIRLCISQLQHCMNNSTTDKVWEVKVRRCGKWMKVWQISLSYSLGIKTIPVINGMRNEGLIVLFKVVEVTTEGIETMILGGQMKK